MKRITTLILLIIFSLFISLSTIIYAQKGEIKITKILNDKFAINKGSQAGIKKGSYYIIIHNGKAVGSSKVIAVQKKISALQIIELDDKYNLKIGDILIYNSYKTTETEAENLLTQLDSKTSINKYPTDRGSKFILGEFSLANMGGDLYEDFEGRNLTTLYIKQNIGSFFVSNFAIAGNFLYNSTLQGGSSIATLGLGPELIYFFNNYNSFSKIKGSTYFFIGTSFLYLNNNLKFQNLLNYTVDGFAGILEIGFVYMLSETIGAITEFDLQYDNLSYKGSDDSISGNQIKLRIGIIGFIY